jgi:hypothetical protein
VSYCVGWRYRKTVYLLADTALTGVPARSSRSSFGELQEQVDGEQVEESTLKLVPIAPGVALTYAGDFFLAKNIIIFIRDNYNEASSPVELFATVDANMGPFVDKNRTVQILLASAPANGPTTLTRWDTVDGIEKRVSDFYEIGSLRTYHRTATLDWLTKFTYEQKVDEALLLPLMTGVVQSYGIHDHLIKQGIGGSIFGVYATAGGVSWQADTAYLVYDSTFSNIHFVYAFVRNEVLIVDSSWTGQPRLFAFPWTNESWEDWWAGLRRNLPAQVVMNWRHCTCLGSSDRRINLIYRNSPDTPSRYINFSLGGDGRIRVEITPELMAELRRPITTEGEVVFGVGLLID